MNDELSTKSKATEQMKAADPKEKPQQLFQVNEQGDIVDSEKQNVVATLRKDESLYEPKVELADVSAFENAEQAKAYQNKIAEWWAAEKSDKLSTLIQLKNNQLKGAASAICIQLFEQFGMTRRHRLMDFIKDLDQEARQALSRYGIRFGAYFVYQRDQIKPANVRVRASMARAYLGLSAQDTPEPKAGLVTLQLSGKLTKEQYQFYEMIGFPVFGQTALRVDMVERVNSHVYDHAVEGKYRFDPALASTIGASVEVIHAVLEDIGFTYEVKNEPTISPEKAQETTEKEAVSQEPEKQEIRYYLLKKRPTKATKTLKPKPQRAAKPKTKAKNKKSNPDNKSNKSSAPKGHNPFDVLKDLTDK